MNFANGMLKGVQINGIARDTSESEFANKGDVHVFGI